MAKKLRVIIADDDVIVRAGVETLLSTFSEVDIVRTCESLDELLEAVAADPPNVVLTDIRMPHQTEGVEAARWIREHHPTVGVVVLSHFVDPELALRVLEDGSSGRGYVLKEHVANAEYLLKALLSVGSGGSFVDSEVLDALVAARRGDQNTALSSLTTRERDVLAEIAEGHSNAAAGEVLSIGERAIEKHISSIFAKLGLTGADQRHRRVSAVLIYLAGRDDLSQGGSGGHGH